MATATDTTSTSGIPIYPDWLLQGEREIAGRASGIAAAPYVGYQGQRIAGLSQDQLNAEQLARQAASGTAVDPRQIQANMSYGLSGFDPNEVNKYMSPYTQGVVNEIGRLGRKELFENVLPGVNTTFTGAGQFGSTRNANFMNTAIQNQNYNVLGQQAKALQDAATAGLNAYTQWHQNSLANAQQGTNMQLTGANALNTVGQQQQEQQQKNLDLAYQDFTTQRDYPKNTLDWYSGILRGQPNTGGQANLNYNTSTPASPLMQGLATAGQIYGLFK